MSSPPNEPNLRLVGGASTTPPSATASRAQAIRETTPALLAAGLSRARRAINQENHAAAEADIDPTDPRWVFAARAHSQLDGAALSPTKRDGLMRTARQLGIRPFDASVIMALVQDRARRGQQLRDITTTLQMMPTPAKRDGILLRWAAAILCAGGAAALLIQWVLAGG